MTEKETGYRGRALDAIVKARANIGDVVRVSEKEEMYEGTLIPRSEYGDEKHLVLKLKNGYNIGVEIGPETKIEKVGEGTKPTFSPPPLPKQRAGLPEVSIISTGGTIASRVDYRTGGVRPALTASDLYSVVPELAKVAHIETEIFLSIFSEDITQQHWKEISQTVADKISKGAHGVVIAHGTDTMGFTAAALSFALQNLPVPVILVGAQRSADRPSSDAATNLLAAVLAAAEAPFADIAVAMHETPSDTTISLHKGVRVRKCHTSRRDAFKSINATPIAKIVNGKLTMLIKEYPKRDTSRKVDLKPEFEERVATIKFYPGMDPTIIDFYAERAYRGIVLEGTGLGHVSRQWHNSIRRVVEKDILVAMTSQCIWGRVNMNVYNAGRDLQALGIIPLEDMLPETALVKLMWVLGQTSDPDESKELLKTNLVGELSPRTLPEESGMEA